VIYFHSKAFEKGCTRITLDASHAFRQTYSDACSGLRHRYTS